MHAIANELPQRGNYFAEADYVQQKLAAGMLQNRAGARMFALPDDMLVALCNTVMEKCGERGSEILKSIGRGWGKHAAEQFTRELGDFHATPLGEQPLSLFAADLTAAFLHHGWGRMQFDFSRYMRGLLVVEVLHPFLGEVVKPTTHSVEALLAGFLSGMFAQFAGIELDCVQTACRARGSASSRFILTASQRLNAIAGWAESGRSHDEILAELEKRPA